MSDTVGQPHGGPPVFYVAEGGGTREEGGRPPLAELGDIERWMTTVEVAAAIEVQAGTVGGG